MRHQFRRGAMIGALAVASWVASGASGATVSGRYDSAASLQAAAATPLLLEDFSRFAPGTEMAGVPFLPGVSVRPNLESLAVYSDYTLLAQPRPPRGIVYWEIIYAIPRRAVGFDIVSFDPATPGPAPLRVLFVDETWQDFNLYPNRAGPAPVFFGVTSNTPIHRILLSEGPGLIEGATAAIRLDNFRVDLPEPVASLALAVAAVALLHRPQRGIETARPEGRAEATGRRRAGDVPRRRTADIHGC